MPEDPTGAGIAVFDGSGNKITFNTLTNNELDLWVVISEGPNLNEIAHNKCSTPDEYCKKSGPVKPKMRFR